MAGMKVQVVEVDKDGNIDLAHLKALVRAGALAFLRSFDRNSGQVTAGYCRLLQVTELHLQSNRDSNCCFKDPEPLRPDHRYRPQYK